MGTAMASGALSEGRKSMQGVGARPALAMLSTPPVLRGARGSSPGAVRWGGRAPGRPVTALPSADREFIEARRRALKRFINLVARHPPFSEDVVLKLFLSFSGPVSTSGTGGPTAPGHAGACRCGGGPR